MVRVFHQGMEFGILVDTSPVHAESSELAFKLLGKGWGEGERES